MILDAENVNKKFIYFCVAVESASVELSKLSNYQKYEKFPSKNYEKSFKNDQSEREN